MSYFLRISNPYTNELVISDQAQGMCCVGRAQLIQTVQPSGSTALGGGGKVNGYQVYRIYHPNPVIFALDLSGAGTLCTILGTSQPAAGVWDVTVYAGNAGQDTGEGFFTQYEIAVWAFSWYNDVLDPKVLSIRDGNNNLKWDFSRRNLLFPRAFGVSPGTGGYVNFSAVTRPVVIGATGSYRNTVGYGVNGKNRFTRNYFRVWTGSGGQIYQYEVAKFSQATGGIFEGDDNNDAIYYDTPFIILEGQDLP